GRGWAQATRPAGRRWSPSSSSRAASSGDDGAAARRRRAARRARHAGGSAGVRRRRFAARGRRAGCGGVRAGRRAGRARRPLAGVRDRGGRARRVHGRRMCGRDAAGAPGLAGAAGAARPSRPTGSDRPRDGADRRRADLLALGPTLRRPLQPGADARVLAPRKGARLGRGVLPPRSLRGRARRRGRRVARARRRARRRPRAVRRHRARPRRRGGRVRGRARDDVRPHGGGAGRLEPARPRPVDGPLRGGARRPLHRARGAAVGDEPEPGPHRGVGRVGGRLAGALGVPDGAPARDAAGSRGLCPGGRRRGRPLRQAPARRRRALHLPLRLRFRPGGAALHGPRPGGGVTVLVERPPASSLVRGPSAALAGTFFLNGLVLASWVAHIPAVKAAHGLGDGPLGLVLLAMAAGAVAALPVAAGLVARWGSRAVTAGALGVLALALPAPLLAPAPGLVAAGLALLGAASATLDVGMNAQAVALEAALGRPILSRCHGLFSLGGLAGAALASGAMGLGVPDRAHVAGVALACLALIPGVQRSLLAAGP